MTCTKTGAHIHLDQYGVYAYCDAFELAGVAIFRIVDEAFEPFGELINYVVFDATYWFDRGKPESTLITRDFSNLGYEGQPIERSKYG